MANPELGAKQLCPNCQAKFYDLNRRPARCPKCETEFDPEEVIKVRKVRGRGAGADYEDTPDEGDEAQVKAKPAGDDEDEEEVSAPEIDEPTDDAPIASDDDEDGADAGPEKATGMGEADDDEVLDDEDDDSVPFIEEDGDDDFEEEIEGIGEDDDEDQ